MDPRSARPRKEGMKTTALDLEAGRRGGSAIGMMAAVLFASAFAACGDVPGDEQRVLYQQIVETRTLDVGTASLVERFGPGGPVELEIPADVVSRPRSIEVSLVTGTVRKGAFPVNDAGLFVQPPGLVFDVPVRVRQTVPPPPAGKRYASVVIPDDGDAFVVRGPGRRVSPPDPARDGYETWEGEGDGSGLWGLALVDDEASQADPSR